MMISVETASISAECMSGEYRGQQVSFAIAHIRDWCAVL